MADYASMPLDWERVAHGMPCAHGIGKWRVQTVALTLGRGRIIVTDGFSVEASW